MDGNSDVAKGGGGCGWFGGSLEGGDEALGEHEGRESRVSAKTLLFCIEYPEQLLDIKIIVEIQYF